MTTGMFAPTGMLVSVNAPPASVVVVTSIWPVRPAIHVSHAAPDVSDPTVPFGTYTLTFGSGCSPAGS